MKEKKKTNSEYIIDALLSGKDLTTPKIREKVFALSGKSMKIQDVASLLAKMTNTEKCSLGYFIRRQKSPRGYIYNLVSELFELNEKEIYDLTRRIGPHRFTIEGAINKSPGLKRYLPGCQKKRMPDRQKKSSRPTMVTDNARHGRMPKIRAGRFKSETNLESLLGAILSKLSTDGLNINIHLDIKL